MRRSVEAESRSQPVDARREHLAHEVGAGAVGCDLALQDMVAIIQETDKVPAAEAQAQAKQWMVPGVILQPSGVFAVLRAQQASALYIRAS